MQNENDRGKQKTDNEAKTDDGQAIPHVDSSKVYTVCHSGDDICLNGDLILVPHLTYAANVAAAAAFATS